MSLIIIIMALHHALVMLWETFWALVLGLVVSAALQTCVSKEQMSRAFGRTNFKTMALATGLGAASSSCSYAAAAAARSAIKQGAAVIPALAFMFASTNLVVELGAVLWILMGWHFVLAEFVGALVLVGCVGALASWFLPKNVRDEMRRHAEAADDGDGGHCRHHHDHGDNDSTMDVPEGKLRQLASAFLMDCRMLWKEILGGFLIAGFLMAAVPSEWWKSFFLADGPGALRMVENAMAGPLVAIASFVCSIGNIPLASLLWARGISFGGVLSFLYADLLVLPLILIYAKLYGARAAVYIVAIFYAAMVLAGITVDLLFSALGLVPAGPRPPSVVQNMHIHWNYTSWLDIAALVIFCSMFLIQSRPAKPGKQCC